MQRQGEEVEGEMLGEGELERRILGKGTSGEERTGAGELLGKGG
jgi:hypothetical protein